MSISGMLSKIRNAIGMSVSETEFKKDIKQLEDRLITIQDQLSTVLRGNEFLTENLFQLKNSQLLLRQGKTILPPLVGEAIKFKSDFNLTTHYEDSLSKLKALCPANFAKWYELLSYNEEVYLKSDIGNCSVNGHSEAILFGSFLLPYLQGSVLDIGCGPQDKPNYLNSHPNDLIYGIDPLKPKGKHPFHFVRSFSEFLPWVDRCFDVIICGTSLDHVLLLDKTYSEVHRTLKKDGVFVVWVSFVKVAVDYNPSVPITPIDQFHLFHFSRTSFLKSISGYFSVLEEYAVSAESCFYTLSKISPG